jgi:hypothetical protein
MISIRIPCVEKVRVLQIIGNKEDLDIGQEVQIEENPK